MFNGSSGFRSAHRDTMFIYLGTALFGLLLWTLDAFAHYFLFPREGQTFWSIAVHGASVHELYMRSIYLSIAVLAGIVLARLNSRRVELQERLDHQNRILAAIRNINQLIVREKDPHRLLDEACRLLVETRWYYNAWIVLTTDGHLKEPFFHAGFDGDFSPMAERLRTGNLPICAQAALASDGVQVNITSPGLCIGCPLASKYQGRAGLSLRLEYASRVFGWISLACPAKYAHSDEEHDLLKEVAGDIAFALYAIDTEMQRESLDHKYAAVLASTSDAAVAVNLDGKILVFNPGAEKLFNCTANEVMGSSFTLFCPEDRREEQREMIRRVLDNGTMTGYETERLTADGRCIPVEISLALNMDDQGRPIGVNGILRDISERKQAEDILRKNHEMLARTESIAHVGSWEWNLDSEHVSWSDELFHIFQIDPAQGAPSFAEQRTLYLEEDIGILQAAVESCISTGAPYEVEIRIVSSDGMIRTCIARGQAEHDAAGRIHRLVGFLQDITEHKLMEEAAKQEHVINQTIIESVPGTFYMIDVNGRYSRWSAYQRDVIVGKPENEVATVNALDTIHPDDRSLVGAKIASVLQNNTEEIVEGRVLLHGGPDYQWMLMTGRQITIKGNPFLIGFGIDITERRQVEEALRESEERFRFLVDYSYDVIWTMKSDGVFSYVSPSWKTRLGHEPSFVEGKTFQPFVHPDDVVLCENYMSQVLEAQTALPGPEFRVRHANGCWRWYDAGMTPVYANDGSFIYFVGISRDITDRKLAEEESARSAALLRDVLDMVPAYICAKNVDGRFLLVNRKLADFYGIPIDTMTGMLHSDLCADDEELQAMLAADRKVIESGCAELIPEETMKKPDGNITFLETYKIPFIADSEPAVLIAAIDITERKLAEDALINRELLLNKIFDVLPIGLWFANESGKLIRGNPAGVKIWGAEPTVPMEAYGVFKARRLPSGEEITPDDWALAHTIREGVTVEDELLEIDAFDGQKKIILNYTAPVLDDQGKIQGAIVLNQDISERERLQAQLRQALKMEAVGRLAGGVAHDFNNMLGIIIGYADMMLAQMDPGQPFYDNFVEIKNAGERSADLTRQLLAFARKQTVTPKVINLNETVKGMLNMLQRLIGENIEMTWIPDEKLWPVKIDPSQIDQILANLCVNARDAIAGVGKMSIETSNIVIDEVYCKDHVGFVPGEYVMLVVSDNGCGMNSETISHLFEPFFTTKELGKGTGLGLATVYGSVKQNNGFINVYSETNLGTTFKIYLPRHFSESVSLPEKVSDKKAGERCYETVLLVEDEVAILKMTTRMLAGEGYNVIAANSPSEAIRLANEFAGDIHLLVSDVVMPEMNGRDLADNIRSIYPGLNFLFMSGYTADIIAQQGVLDADVNFIQKPFSISELTHKVREVLDQD